VARVAGGSRLGLQPGGWIVAWDRVLLFVGLGRRDQARIRALGIVQMVGESDDFYCIMVQRTTELV
jgi:hypothetical protein